MDRLDTLAVAQAEGRAPWTIVQFETRDFVIFNDGFPVTPGHTLVVPRDATLDSIMKCFKYACTMGHENVQVQNNEITGYNVGINIGESAGQTCMYPHVHLIFRRDGDTEDPTGGVRNVIPGAGSYTNGQY